VTVAQKERVGLWIHLPHYVTLAQTVSQDRLSFFWFFAGNPANLSGLAAGA
jgi:hypothetical protein